MFKYILQEPLLHFLVVGSLLFFYLSGNDTHSKLQVSITQGKIKQLTAQFNKSRQRYPSDEELNALINNQIREDLAFAHGVQMGLIENDSIIKRRVQQKIEFMLNDSIASIEPGREELQAYLDAHKDQYTIAPRYTFKQIYINPEQHENSTAFIAQLQSKELNKVYKNVGDIIMVQNEFSQVSSAQIARLLGRDFVKSLETLALHSWQGPVKSAYGLHLVKIESKIPRHLATLEEIEVEVRRDFRSYSQKRAINAFYDELKMKYDVKVEELE